MVILVSVGAARCEWAILPARAGLLASGRANAANHDTVWLHDNRVYINGKVTEVGVWQPSPSQVEVAEGLLASYLHQQGWQARAKSLPDFYRQYVGVVRRRRHLIYLNAIHRSLAVDPPDRWLHELITLEAGGDMLWQVEYDPLHKQFSGLPRCKPGLSQNESRPSGGDNPGSGRGSALAHALRDR